MATLVIPNLNCSIRTCWDANVSRITTYTRIDGICMPCKLTQDSITLQLTKLNWPIKTTCHHTFSIICKTYGRNRFGKCFYSLWFANVFIQIPYFNKRIPSTSDNTISYLAKGKTSNTFIMSKYFMRDRTWSIINSKEWCISYLYILERI